LGRVWIGTREQLEHLRRLAVVFAVPIRLRIVTELYQRDMSPKQFYEEFGGRSVSRVAKHFERLVETGWLRLVRTVGPGGKRRGGTETIYRATELAFCDRETYAALPYSLRLGFSWNAFKEIAGLLRSAMEAQTFQARSDHRLTALRVLLDKAGWERVVTAVETEFAAQFEEQEDARRRAEHDGAELFRAGSLLLCYELPHKAGLRVGPTLAEGDPLTVPFPVCLSKVWEDEVCLQIVEDGNRGDTSVPMFHQKYGEQFGLDKDTIRRRFRKVETHHVMKQVGQMSGGRRHGGVEKVYRATAPAIRDRRETGPWANVPKSIAQTEDWQRFAQLTDWLKEAITAGTVTRRDETCLAWSELHLDQQGWQNLARSLEALHAFILKEQELAAVRLKKSGEQPIVMAVGLGAFETPKPIKES